MESRRYTQEEKEKSISYMEFLFSKIYKKGSITIPKLKEDSTLIRFDKGRHRLWSNLNFDFEHVAIVPKSHLKELHDYYDREMFEHLCYWEFRWWHNRPISKLECVIFKYIKEQKPGILFWDGKERKVQLIYCGCN